MAASGQLVDNSFLTHLATGRLIWDGEGVPRHDPYTFTAAGEPWVVQSWLASVAYGGLERLGGLEAIRTAVALAGGLLAGMGWLLSRPAATVTARVATVVPFLLVGLDGWTERPLLLGLVALAAVLAAAEGHLDARWLVPVTWVWVSFHGSWPLGGLVLVLLAAGRRLDGVRPTVELRALAWYSVGLVASLLNPYGWRLLTFPVDLLSRREALSGIREWRPPQFDQLPEQMFLLVLAVALLALLRARSWRVGLPLVVFGALALTGARNVLPASVVVLPGTAAGLAGLGSIAGDRRGVAARAAGATGLALAGVVVAGAATGDPLREGPYPVAAVRWLEAHELSPATHRILAREGVGNWFEFSYGATGNVFADDRVEVIPLAVVEDHRALLRADPSWDAILERYEVDAVLWEATSELAPLLAEAASWEIVYEDDRWLVAVPR